MSNEHEHKKALLPEEAEQRTGQAVTPAIEFLHKLVALMAGDTVFSVGQYCFDNRDMIEDIVASAQCSPEATPLTDAEQVLLSRDAALESWVQSRLPQRPTQAVTADECAELLKKGAELQDKMKPMVKAMQGGEWDIPDADGDTHRNPYEQRTTKPVISVDRHRVGYRLNLPNVWKVGVLVNDDEARELLSALRVAIEGHDVDPPRTDYPRPQLDEVISAAREAVHRAHKNGGTYTLARWAIDDLADALRELVEPRSETATTNVGMNTEKRGSDG